MVDTPDYSKFAINEHFEAPLPTKTWGTVMLEDRPWNSFVFLEFNALPAIMGSGNPHELRIIVDDNLVAVSLISPPPENIPPSPRNRQQIGYASATVKMDAGKPCKIVFALVDTVANATNPLRSGYSRVSVTRMPVLGQVRDIGFAPGL